MTSTNSKNPENTEGEAIATTTVTNTVSSAPAGNLVSKGDGEPFTSATTY